jgi:hypothetical protein
LCLLTAILDTSTLGEQSLDTPDVHVLLEEMVVVAPLSLGLVHRGVRTLDKGIRIVTVLGVDTDTKHCR